MKKAWIVAHCLGVLFLLEAPLRGAQVSVVTTTSDLAAIAEAIGGDRVRVKSIARGPQDPHYVAAKPSYMRLLNRADLLLFVGLQLEIGWLPLLVQGARNPELIAVNLSEGISVMEVPEGEITRAQGDIHPEGNPHYWLDPRNGLLMARRIAGQLKALNPKDRGYFEERERVFTRDLTNRIRGWEGRMAPYRGQQVVAYHKQWEYLAGWLGVSIIDYVENKPGIPPAPKHIAGLIQTMRGRRIKALWVANFVRPNIPRSVADRTGARMVVLPSSVGAEKGIETYGALFDVITGRLDQALR